MIFFNIKIVPFFCFILSVLCNADNSKTNTIDLLGSLLKDTTICKYSDNCEYLRQNLEKIFSLEMINNQSCKDSVCRSSGQSKKTGITVVLMCTLKQAGFNWNIDIYLQDSLFVCLSEMEELFGKATIKYWSKKIKSGSYLEFNTSQSLIYSKFNISARYSFIDAKGEKLIKSINIGCNQKGQF